MVLAVGSHKRVKYEFQTKPEMMQDYFKIVEEANKQLIILLNKQKYKVPSFFLSSHSAKSVLNSII